jgi:predicted dehydrogenase
MTRRPLRVGVAGLRRGLALLRMFRPHPCAEVTAVCDPDAARATTIAAEHQVEGVYTTFDAFLDHGLDIVVVASPLPLHVSQSIAALRAGAHVLCEVPAVASLEEAEQLVAAVREASTLYMLAENCCYWAFVESWQAMVDAGRIGEPMFAEAEYVHDCRGMLRNPDGSPTWRAFLPPIQYCTHSLGPVLKAIGGRPVSAIGLSTGSRLTPEFGTIDMQLGLFRTDRGVPIKILCGFGVVRQPSFHSYVIYGTRGCLERPRPGGSSPVEETLAYFEDIPEMAGMATLPLGVRHPRAPAHASTGGHGTAEWAMVNAFLEAIVEGGRAPIDVHAALDMTLPGLCAHFSSEQGGVAVDVPDYR